MHHDAHVARSAANDPCARAVEEFPSPRTGTTRRFGGKEESRDVDRRRRRTTVRREGRSRAWVAKNVSPTPTKGRRRLSHSPSGVVEVLEVPEEAGLFLRVVYRIFIQDAGHAYWNDAGARGQMSVTHTAVGREPSHGRCACRLCCTSALNVREHLTSSSSAASVSASLSPVAAAEAVIYVATDL